MTTNQEIRTGPLSGSTSGRPIIIASSTNTSATIIHDITSAAAVQDSMFIRVQNDTGSNILVSVVIMPNDDTVSGDVDDATVVYTVPRQGSVWVMEGERIQYDASLTNYHVGMYTTSGAVSAESLRVTGWFNRITQATVTP